MYAKPVLRVGWKMNSHSSRPVGHRRYPAQSVLPKLDATLFRSERMQLKTSVEIFEESTKTIAHLHRGLRCTQGRELNLELANYWILPA